MKKMEKEVDLRMAQKIVTYLKIWAVQHNLLHCLQVV